MAYTLKFSGLLGHAIEAVFTCHYIFMYAISDRRLTTIKYSRSFFK